MRLLPLLLLLTACPPILQSDDDDSAEPSTTCSDLLAEAEWAVDPEGEAGQIHPKSRFIGDRIWTAYNRPDGGNTFAVFVVVRACDGSLVAGPTRLDDGSGNSTDPDLVASGDRVLVSWQTDDSNTPWNLSVRTALLDLEGTVVRGDQRVELLRDSAAWPGNGWMSRLASLPDGFALALSFANDDTTIFGAAVQRLDADGAPVGDAIHTGDGVTPGFEPSLASDPDGGLWLSWVEDLSGGGPAQGRRIEPGASTADLQAWPLAGPNSAGFVLAVDGEGTLWGASAVDAARVDVSPPSAFVQERADDGSGGQRFAVGLSPRASGGVVAWAEGTPNSASFLARAFDGDGGWTSEPTRVVEGPAGGYAADVVDLAEGFILVTSAEGGSPDFGLRARVLSLP